MVYGSHSATRLALKMSKRSDKYLICAAVNAELGYDEVIKQVDKFPAIVICDVKGKPAESNIEILLRKIYSGLYHP